MNTRGAAGKQLEPSVASHGLIVLVEQLDDCNGRILKAQRASLRPDVGCSNDLSPLLRFLGN
jgi:hypothetical protein